MTWFIKVGGALVIIAVCTIFIFILMQILPLFRGASVRATGTVPVPAGDYLALGIDEWGQLPFLVERSGKAVFIPVDEGAAAATHDLKLEAGRSIAAAHYDALSHQLMLGLDDGRLLVSEILYSSADRDGRQVIESGIKQVFDLRFGELAAPIVDVAFRDAGSAKLAAAILDVDGARSVRALTLVQPVVLGRKGTVKVGADLDLTPELAGTPVRVLVNASADSVVVATTEGEIFCFAVGEDGFALRQRFAPFADAPTPTIASIDFLLGGVSLVLTGADGRNEIWSLHHPAGEHERRFGRVATLDPLPGGGATWYDASVRNKAFLFGNDHSASLRFATTGHRRWEHKLDGPVAAGVINGKYDRLVLLDQATVEKTSPEKASPDQASPVKASQLRVFALSDPHPESSFATFFGKIWYEGASKPEYTWQSSGGSDDFEPKLSLVPLVVGTLKGTFFALLFAVPIALLAAVYTSEFMRPRFKLYVKPVMELMASLPSVVLGFIAALWLAPLIETRVPTIICAVALVPLVAMGFGWTWARLPVRMRAWLGQGYEFLVFVPILLASVWLAALLGPLLESAICRVPIGDPQAGQTIADFRLWWPYITGSPFEQRNALIVGFVMGFAVIPIIYTISEDSLSGVPKALRSGSLALGASRWQTAFQVVVPTASAGIFSAVMIGLGRAVGETMIMVMATGNTPIMDMNIFSGMRTLSANIAVELPEAPAHSTLFRALFLGAFLLFLMTFAVNTIAELLRQWLREKYKTV